MAFAYHNAKGFMLAMMSEFIHKSHIKEMAMDIRSAQEILDEVLREHDGKQQAAIIQPDDGVTLHNGVSPKTAAFIDSLSNDKIMAKVVKELSNDVNELMMGVDEFD